MKRKWSIFSILIIYLTFTIISYCNAAINTADIDRVRNKAVLDSRDLQIIDDFFVEAVGELIRTVDFTSIAKTRTVILSRKGTQAQYSRQFSESAFRHISAGLEQAQSAQGGPEERKFKVLLNLLILIDGLGDPRLVELAIGMLKDENKALRYWAVRSITNPKLIEKINPSNTEDSQLAQQIADQLMEIVDSSSPEVLALMAEFVAIVNIPQSEDLLLKIVDTRIKEYADWTVEYELLDGVILKQLCNKITSTITNKPDIARRFAQLYSYAIQRYIKGREILSDANKRYLASVLIETEDKCISKLLVRPQINIKRAVEQNNYPALQQEHKRLLGGQTDIGELPLKLKFDYITDEDGNRHTEPNMLPEPPM